MDTSSKISSLQSSWVKKLYVGRERVKGALRTNGLIMHLGKT